MEHSSNPEFKSGVEKYEHIGKVMPNTDKVMDKWYCIEAQNFLFEKSPILTMWLWDRQFDKTAAIAIPLEQNQEKIDEDLIAGDYLKIVFDVTRQELLSSLQKLDLHNDSEWLFI